MALENWTDVQILEQLISDYRWYGQALLYGFPTTTSAIVGEGEKAGFQSFNASQQDVASLALKLWDDLIAPDFTKTNLNSDVDFAYTNTDIGFAQAYYPKDGTIWFNKNEKVLTSPVISEHGFFSFVHEIGHALGLNHMGNYDGEGDWKPSSYQDSTVYTVMSYFGPNWLKGDDNVAWADWIASGEILNSPQTPGIYDIQAIQKIYGVETTTRAGDTVYGFNSNITGSEKKIFDFQINQSPIITIFDSEGVDTLDLSGWSVSSQIDLAPGSFSSTNSMTNNISIAFSAIIENARGGNGNDTILGNQSNNKLTGLAGDDNINGGDGVDTAIYNGNFRDYKIFYDKVTKTITLTDKVTNRDGKDILGSIEYLQFLDKTVTSDYIIPSEIIVGKFINDLFNAVSGNQEYAGLGGFDVLTLTGNRSDYSIESSGPKIFITDTVINRDGKDTTNDVEILKFKDGVLALDVAQTEDNALLYRLYKAAFARVPDEDGFRYWLEKSNNGVPIQEIAGSFRGSAEFISKYGSDLSKQNYVDQLYINVLGRAGDMDGKDYWIQQLATNQLSENQVLIKFADSPENKINTEFNLEIGYWFV